jgi:thioredoxin 1
MAGYISNDRIHTVTSRSFGALVLEDKGPVVVEFMSYGCMHCRMIEPVLQQVAEIVESTEKVFRVNTAVEPELSDRYEIQGTPTLVMFLNGQVVGRVEGPSPVVSSVLAEITQPYAS